jgi:ferritin-like metal-binding protein YciE
METAQPNNQNNDIVFENDVKYPKLKSKGTGGLCDLLLNEVKLIYDVKKTGLKSFPKVIKNACSFELIEAVTKHFEETKKQLIRLEDVFTILEENPVAVTCNSMKSLLREMDDVTENTKFGTVRDAGIILAFHKIVHYEISAYTILSAFAQIIDEQQIIDLIEESLNESKVTELRLLKILSFLQLSSDEN